MSSCGTDPVHTTVNVHMCACFNTRAGDGNWTGAHIGGIAVMSSFGWVHKPGGEVYRDSFVFSR
jgi:hypothetical protein